MTSASHCRALRVLSALLALFLCTGALLRAQTTLTSTITAPLDDMEEWLQGGVAGTVDWNSSDLEMINEGSGDQIIGLRFSGLSIPQGAYITNATIQFTCDETNNGATTLTFQCEASDNSAAFVNANNAVSSRTRNATSVNWTVNPWNTIQERGADQRTSNLRTIVQEVVNRPGWTTSSALTFIISGSGKRVAESVEGATSGAAGHAASQAPTLTVEYIVPTTVSVRVAASSDDAEENLATGAMDLTSSDLELSEDGAINQYIGMRFPSLNIPRNATIVSAYVQFATDELFSIPTTQTIRAQTADNAATFTTTAFNLSSRAVTSANVSWTPPGWTVLQEAGAGQRTPDLTNVVQEVISRAGWNANNALVVRMNGTGRRTAEAWDGSAPEAPQLVVRYVSLTRPVAPVGVFPVPRTAVWSYLDDGSDQGTAWRAPNFNDSLWSFGPAQLGFGDGDEATTVGFGPNANSKYITTYFRHTFNVTDTASFDSLQLSLLRDDGAVVYLNGVEVMRSNMPSGAVTSSTFAASNVGGAAETSYFTQTIGKSGLVIGRNVLAVEIHQDAVTSSDLSFVLEVTPRKSDVRLVNAGSIWEYWDRATQPVAGWQGQTLTDTLWKTGPAVLGYGNGNEATRLSFGPNRADKYPAAYFRRTFNVTDTIGFRTLLMRLKYDDGAAVYLNGVELFRANMPAGALNNRTYAVDYVEGADENAWQEYVLPVSSIRMGTNTIAVEVHQNSATSTDLAFDLDLTLQETVRTFTSLGHGTFVMCDPSSSSSIGCFTSIVPTTQTQSFLYPTATHTFQRLVKSTQTRYTGTTTTVPNGNDFTGFIPDSGSSKRGHLSINHENSPGGVTMTAIHYVDSTKLWSVDTVKNVNYGPVVQSIRNCSGGVTPWGTVLSSEESYNTGDANSDGYQDVGWHTEINPWTGAIVDHDNNGQPDKLWAIGRMNHENIVVARDSMTCYQGEDGGTGCVYKFVADRKGDLSSGALYVLKRDAATPFTGTWVRVPNTTQTERNTVSTVAGALGGTNWGGVEDVEIDSSGMVFFTEKNRGDIWCFRDNGSTVSNLQAWVSNVNLTINSDRGPVTEPWNTGNDNLAFDGDGNLWVMQDGGKDLMWVVRPDHTPSNPHVDLFGSTPAGSEPTGITFSPDHRFLFMSFQNPSGTNTVSQRDAADSNIVFNASTTLVIARKENLGRGPVAPTVNLGRDLSICDGTPVRLTYSNPDAFYRWSDNSTDSVLTVTRSGNYSITVIGNNGIVARDTVRVTYIDPPTVELGNTQKICAGDEVMLHAATAAGNTVVWDDFSTDTNRLVRQPGFYYATVTGPGGCISRDTVLVELSPAPQPSLGEDVKICGGQPFRLDPGSNFITYRWNTGANNRTIDVTAPGIYWVRVTNLEGCVGYDTIVVTPTTPLSLGTDLRFCEGGSAILNAGTGFVSYLWSDSSTSATLKVTTSGNYWVRATNPEGCEVTDTVRVTVAPLPQVELGRDTSICAGCTLTLDAGAGSSYRWNTGETTRTITVDSAGRYSVEVTSPDGCVADDDIFVSLTPVAGVEDRISTRAFSMRAWPNPFSTSFTLELNLVARGTLRVEVIDANGRTVATIANREETAGEHHIAVDAAALGLTQGVYLLKVSAGGADASYRIVRQ